MLPPPANAREKGYSLIATTDGKLGSNTAGKVTTTQKRLTALEEINRRKPILFRETLPIRGLG